MFLHGNAMSGRDWDTSGVAEALVRTNRVIVFDRPGFGYSSRPRGRAWTATEQAELLHRALTMLGVRRPVLVGHSWGTLASVAFALRFPADTAGLVLVSGYYFPVPRLDVPLVAPAAAPVLGDVLRWTVSPLLGRFLMHDTKRAIFAPAPVTARFEAEYSTAMALRPSQIRATAMDGEKLNRVVRNFPPARYGGLGTLPVAVLAGAGDRVVDRNQARRLHAAVPGSTLRIVEGAGHMVHHTAPEEVLDAVAEVVRRSDASARSA